MRDAANFLVEHGRAGLNHPLADGLQGVGKPGHHLAQRAPHARRGSQAVHPGQPLVHPDQTQTATTDDAETDRRSTVDGLKLHVLTTALLLTPAQRFFGPLAFNELTNLVTDG
jgi:hypothetical protein